MTKKRKTELRKELLTSIKATVYMHSDEANHVEMDIETMMEQLIDEVNDEAYDRGYAEGESDSQN
jgi:hypothetical protein